jgi:response regulator RpfG family c-di-GMP phosphodiesterase
MVKTKKHPQNSLMRLLLGMAHRVDTRVSLSGKHSTQVAQWVSLTSRELRCTENSVRINHWAAQLHDIGKIGVPDSVLSKAGPLSPSEWDVMRLHPGVGANIVTALNWMPGIAKVIYSHQEKYDGSGYPEGLKGTQIPLGARIVTVVDAYQAMTDNRAYSKARSQEEARQELLHMSGKQFDPMVVEKFIKVLDNHGSRLLNTGLYV